MKKARLYKVSYPPPRRDDFKTFQRGVKKGRKSGKRGKRKKMRRNGRTKGQKIEIWWDFGKLFQIGHRKAFKFDGTIYTPEKR